MSGDREPLPASWVCFPSARTYVAARHLPRHLMELAGAWLRLRTSSREVLRTLWRPSLRRTLPPDLDELAAVARELDLDVFMVRYPTDGGRYQVVALDGRRIAKIAKPGGINTIAEELEARGRCPEMSPRVLAVTRAGNALLEERLTPHVGGYSLRVLSGVVRSLTGTLYGNERPTLREYYAALREVSPAVDEVDVEALLATAGRILGRDLTVSWVHGDLTTDNLLVDAEGRVRLTDWEYARPCLLTYDGWHYVYQHHIQQNQGTVAEGATVGEAFYRDFISILPLYWLPESASLALALHVIHLLERYSFLHRHFPATTAVLRQVLKQDLRAAGRALLRDHP